MGMTWSKPYQNTGVTWSNFVLRFWVLLDMTRHVLFLLHLVDKTRLRVTESKFKSEFWNCNCKKKSKGKRKQDRSKGVGLSVHFTIQTKFIKDVLLTARRALALNIGEFSLKLAWQMRQLSIIYWKKRKKTNHKNCHCSPEAYREFYQIPWRMNCFVPMLRISF